jgi:hypothetical protein
MKQTMIFIGMLSIVVLLAACGQSAVSGTATASATGALPEQTQLIVGTFKLENTANAVDAAQAKDLVLYYKLLSSLEGSSTSSQQEVTAVVDKINTSMTAAQLKAIADMKLTREDMMKVISEQGLMNSNSAAAASSGSSSSSRSSSGGGMSFGGGMPSGGIPSGGGAPSGGGMPGGGDFSSSLSAATVQARRSSTGLSGGNFNEALINALIKVLEAKLQ